MAVLDTARNGRHADDDGGGCATDGHQDRCTRPKHASSHASCGTPSATDGWSTDYDGNTITDAPLRPSSGVSGPSYESACHHGYRTSLASERWM
ncbi:hypothetical protein ALC56_06057 [Trachymyrmex septentrionalis]|uniref:Uncharacterized protein n=1 Tax=Trachymyrmex septentrionalis TaxID=34720 RepID=A0A195FGP5_9HYME|nr:hypothetical protein ALC56_06057 [Trachymyrmex septentrionalis]